MCYTLVILLVQLCAPSIACEFHGPAQETLTPATATSYTVVAPYEVIRPIPLDELLSIGQILKLSRAQELFIARVHKVYLEGAHSVRSQALVEVRADAILLGEMMMHYDYTEAYAERVRVFYHKQEQTNRQLLAVEEELFLQIESILTEEQREMMPAARLSRERSRYPVRDPSIPAANVDLVVLVNDLLLPHEDPADVFDLLRAYEAEIGPLRRQRHQAWVHRRIENAKFLAQNAINHPHAIENRTQILRPVVLLDERLRSVNLSYLNLLKGAMPPADAVSLQDRYDRRVHPDFYPDSGRHAVEELIKSHQSNRSLTEDDKKVVAQNLETYAIEYDLLRQRIERLVLKQMREFSLSLTTYADQENAHAQEVRAALEDRERLNQLYLNIITDILNK